jgi:outer membrane murein-binding lipoprotein Lpp
MRRLTLCSTLISTLLLSGCSFHPLGIPDKEWEMMSQEQRMAAYSKQAEVDKAEQAARMREAELEAEREREVRRELEARRANAQPGDLLQCVFEPLEMRRYNDEWQPMQGFAVELVRGESAEIDLNNAKGYSYSAWVNFSQSGQTLSLCAYRPRGDDTSDCANVLMTHREVFQGVRQKLGYNDKFRGHVRCDPVMRPRGSSYRGSSYPSESYRDSSHAKPYYN